jgi:hypothetical protein
MAREKRLFGVVETGTHSWWVILDQNLPQGLADMAFRLWEAIFNWMTRGAFVIERHFDRLPEAAISIHVRLEDLANWEELRPQAFTGSGEAPHATYSDNEGVTLTLPSGCLVHFFKPTNIGERLCLEAIIEAMHRRIHDLDSSPSTKELVDEIVRDDGARFFHLLRANSFRDRLSATTRPPKPTFLAEEDDAWCRLGLAWLVREPTTTGDEVIGEKACVDFLNSLVDAVWARLRPQLEGFDRLALARRALENVEAIAFDERHWRTTARALLALHNDRDDVVRAAHERAGARNAASLASRVLVEMAVCTCAVNKAVTKPSQADFDNLLANVMLLANLGQYSDAIWQGYAPAEIRIAACGRFDLRTDFHDTVLLPRARDILGGQFAAAAREYNRYFEEVGESRPAADVFEDEFLKAFQAEFGTSVETVVGFVAALQNHALKKARYVLELEEKGLRAIAVAENVDAASVDAILGSFTLPEREHWDEREPKGFRAKDWYPWRYRRRLSLVSRPIVKVTSDVGTIYMISPGLLETGVRYVVLRSAEGALPEDYFRMRMMRAWIGEANNRRGHAFNEAVAERLQASGFWARCEVKSSEIAAGTLNEDLGDIDVLAWQEATGQVLAVECKDLHEARTASEVAEQLGRFRGGYDAKGRPDELRKHLRRADWLSQNLALLSRFLGLSPNRIRTEPYLVFSDRTPLKYVSDLPLPNNNIITIDEIEGMR